jgi:hypothetical protein
MWQWQWTWTGYGWQPVLRWVNWYQPGAIASYPGFGYGTQPIYSSGYTGSPYWTWPGQAVSVHYDVP